MVCHSFMFGPVFSIFVLRIGVGKHTNISHGVGKGSFRVLSSGWSLMEDGLKG